MSEFLFKEFEEVSAKQWKQKIQYDLKGADYTETLVWQSLEGINVKPFYHQDDFIEGFAPIPGQPKSWKIAQEVFIDDFTIANNIAMEALNRGVESIIFKASREFDIEAVFKNFPFETIILYFELDFLSREFISELKAFLSKQKSTVYYNIDIIGNLAKTGNWFHNQKEDYLLLEDILLKNTSANLLGVNCSIYQNAGTTPILLRNLFTKMQIEANLKPYASIHAVLPRIQPFNYTQLYMLLWLRAASMVLNNHSAKICIPLVKNWTVNVETGEITL